METLTLSADEATGLLTDTHGMVVDRIEPLGSELASTFRVESGEQVLALKIQGATEESLDIVLWRAQIMTELSRRGHRVPKLLPSRTGDSAPVVTVQGRPAVVQAIEWENAVPYSAVVYRRELAFEVGRQAALLQQDLADLPRPPATITHPWDAQHAAATLTDHLRGDLDAEARRVGAVAVEIHDCFVRPVIDDLPIALVHQDLNDFNVLTRADGEFAAIIDFDDMLVGWRVAEPAIAGGYLARQASDPLDALRETARGWESVLPFTDAEREAYVPVAAMRLALNTVVWASRATGPRAEYARARSQGSVAVFDTLAGSLLG